MMIVWHTFSAVCAYEPPVFDVFGHILVDTGLDYLRLDVVFELSEVEQSRVVFDLAPVLIQMFLHELLEPILT